MTCHGRERLQEIDILGFACEQGTSVPLRSRCQHRMEYGQGFLKSTQEWDDRCFYKVNIAYDEEIEVEWEEMMGETGHQ